MTNISSVKRVDVSIECPRDQGRIWKTEIVLLPHNGSYIPVPCGCDQSTGNDICMRCLAYVTKRFIDDPETDATHPFAPPVREG